MPGSVMGSVSPRYSALPASTVTMFDMGNIARTPGAGKGSPGDGSCRTTLTAIRMRGRKAGLHAAAVRCQASFSILIPPHSQGVGVYIYI